MIEAHRLELSLEQQAKPLVERFPREVGLQIVTGIEKSLSTGLALAAGQRAEAVEASGNRRDEPPFAAAIGGNGPKQGWAGLVGAVRAAQPLDRRVSTPTGLEEIVNAASLIERVEAGMIAPSRAAGVGKDQDALFAAHEAVGLREVRARAAPFDPLTALGIDDDPPTATRHLGHCLRPEMPDDMIERRADHRQRTELLEELVAHGHRFPAQHGLPSLVDHRFRAHRAAIVGIGAHLAHRKGRRQIVDQEFFAVAVYVERGGGRRRFPSVFHDFTPDNMRARGCAETG